VDRFDFIGRLCPTVLHKDSEIRAEEGTQPAVDAVGIVNELRRMVAFGVGALRHNKHTLGTELNTETASFASFLDDVDDAVGYLDAIPIQGLSPIGHSPSQILH
jgi:hypothetical protein